MLDSIFVKVESSWYTIYWELPLPQLHINSFVHPQVANPFSEKACACSWSRQRPCSWIQTNISEPKMVWCVALDTGRRPTNFQRGQCLIQSETKALASVFFLNQRLSIKLSWRNSAPSSLSRPLMRYNMAAASKHSNLFLFYLEINFKKT